MYSADMALAIDNSTVAFRFSLRSEHPQRLF